MPVSAFGLVLVAAFLHASWNLLLKASPDRLVAAAVQSGAGALVLAPALVAGGYPGELWPWLAGSTLLHLGYGLSLVRGYQRGELSTVYPIARGSAPLLVALGAAVLLGDVLTPAAWAGTGLIALGVLAVARRRPSGVGWALLCSGFIVGYTIVDGAAVRAEGGSLRYTAALFLTNTVTMASVALLRRRWEGFRRAVVAPGWGRNLSGGAASAAAYLLVLIAARSAPLGAVSALRETSVVVGAALGWLVLREPFGRSRVAASVVIAIGAALLVV